MALVDDLLNSIDRESRPTIMFEVEGFTYVLLSESSILWMIRKLDGSRLAAEYTIKRSQIGKPWTCNCPAGIRNRSCKHTTWISAIADSFFQRKAR